MNFIVNDEKHITDLLKPETISENIYKSLKPRRSTCAILYGFCKLHRQLADNCPPFIPIMPAVKTSTYNLPKFLVSLLESITANMYTVKGCIEFAKEIADQDPRFFMASLDVKSLFTNIPLEETINVCCDYLFSNNAKVNNINRIDFEKLLTAALQNNFLNFEEKIYEKIDGVTMGSSLDPTLANAFLCFHKQIWLNECSAEFKPVYYRRYVDDNLFCFVHLIILRNSNII